MTLHELPDWARQFLVTERVARLAFNDAEGHPRVLPVTYAVVGDSVWSAIDQKPKQSAEPARLRYLRDRPQAALCVDRYSDDWASLAWVQLLGTIDIVSIDEAPHVVSELAQKYQPYRNQTPPGPLLRLTVDRPLSWRASPASIP